MKIKNSTISSEDDKGQLLLCFNLQGQTVSHPLWKVNSSVKMHDFF